MGPILSRPAVLVGILRISCRKCRKPAERLGNRKWRMVTSARCIWVWVYEQPTFPCWPSTEMESTDVSMCRKGRPTALSELSKLLSLISQYICLYGRLSTNPGTPILTSEPQCFLLQALSSGAGCPSDCLVWVLRRDVQLCLHICGWCCAYLCSLSRVYVSPHLTAPKL